MRFQDTSLLKMGKRNLDAKSRENLGTMVRSVSIVNNGANEQIIQIKRTRMHCHRNSHNKTQSMAVC